MTTIGSIDNGVNVQALLDAREALKASPEAAQFTWRSTTRWENGVHTTSTVKHFFGLGAEQTHKAQSEFTADHLPAFLRGEAPRAYLSVYPFVRTPEWYLLPAEERSAMLREHGEMGREFPDVLANTTSAFGLGDWEWILAFEADDLSRLVDCIRRLRAAEARRFTKVEVPFVTGIRKELPDAVRDLT